MAQAAPIGVAPKIERLAISANDIQASPGGANLSERDLAPFSLFGVTWDSGPAPIMQYRVEAGGTWTSWAEVPTEDAAAEGGGTRPGSDPVWTDSATGIEIKVLAGSPSGLTVDLIDPGRTASDRSIPKNSTAGTPTHQAPTIISRSGWAADENLGEDCSKVYGKTIRAAVVHHTAGVNNYTADKSAGIVRGIHAYHVQSRGYCDIAYNFLVDRFGRIFEGRAGGNDLPVHGAHARDWNTDTVGVSMMGNHTTVGPTKEAFDATASVVAWKLAGNYRNPKATLTLAGKKVNTIFTHGDVVNTDCPGEKMDARMGEFRNLVAQKMGDWKTGNWSKWQSAGGESGWMGSPVRLEQTSNGGSRTEFTNADVYGKNNKIHWVKGGIRTQYRKLGGGASKLGFPTSDEYKITGGARSNFERGTITWDSATKKAIVKYAG